MQIYIKLDGTSVANSPSSYRSLLGPSGPKCPGVSGSALSRGVRGSVTWGACRPLRAPGSRVSRKCPESVPGVSNGCPGHSRDTLGTLFGHSGAWGPKGPADTRGHFLDTSGPKGPRDSCSWTRSSQNQAPQTRRAVLNLYLGSSRGVAADVEKCQRGAKETESQLGALSHVFTRMSVLTSVVTRSLSQRHTHTLTKHTTHATHTQTTHTHTHETHKARLNMT